MSVEAVTTEEVRRVAELANLELTPDEERTLRRDLNATLEHIAKLNELDTRKVPAMEQVGEVLGIKSEESGAALRLDAVRSSLNRKAVMASAPETDGRFYKVPKVIER